jgi:uncharacterized protein (DUF427 family)
LIAKEETARMTRAIWNGVVVAESDETEVVEGDHYFPPESVMRDYLVRSETTSVCPWKGVATYFHLEVDGEIQSDAAFCYAEPKEAARRIKNHVAFWKGVEVEA